MSQSLSQNLFTPTVVPLRGAVPDTGADLFEAVANGKRLRAIAYRLKIAARKQPTGNVLLLAWKMALDWNGNPKVPLTSTRSKISLFRDFVFCFFVPDGQGQTAVCHSALAGKKDTVKVILALFIMLSLDQARGCENYLSLKSLKLSLEKWLLLFHLPFSFQANRLNRLILKLDPETKALITSCGFKLQDILSIATKGVSRSYPNGVSCGGPRFREELGQSGPLVDLVRLKADVALKDVVRHKADLLQEAFSCPRIAIKPSKAKPTLNVGSSWREDFLPDPEDDEFSENDECPTEHSPMAGVDRQAAVREFFENNECPNEHSPIAVGFFENNISPTEHSPPPDRQAAVHQTEEEDVSLAFMLAESSETAGMEDEEIRMIARDQSPQDLSKSSDFRSSSDWDGTSSIAFSDSDLLSISDPVGRETEGFDDWDVVSSPGSLVSVGASTSLPISYLDALMSKHKQNVETPEVPVSLSLAKEAPVRLRPIQEDSLDSEFDAFFLMEGVKQGRPPRAYVKGKRGFHR